MKSISTALTFFAAILFTTFIAYASNSGPSVEELRDNMHTAKANAIYNGNRWKAQLQNSEHLSVLARPDPAQSAACPQGSGWATVELIDRIFGTVEVLKCSTVSALAGCVREQEYALTKHAEHAAECAPLKDVPYPLARLTM